MLRRAGIVVVVATALLATPLRGDEQPSVESILARYIDAVGGRDALERLATRVCMGRVVTELSWTDPRVQVDHFVAWASAPDHIRVITEETNGSIIVEVGDTETGWKCIDGEVDAEEDFGRSKLVWILNPQNALRVEEYFPGLEAKGYEILEGRRVWILEPAALDPAYWRLGFDAETGLLVTIGYYWTLEDYREVDGVLFPFRASVSRKGGSSTYYFEHVWHNVAG